MSDVFSFNYRGNNYPCTKAVLDVWMDMKSDEARDSFICSMGLLPKWVTTSKEKLNDLMAGKPVEGSEVLDPGIMSVDKTLEPKTLSIEATLAQRGKRYGDFTDHARICQDLKDVMVNSRTNPTGNCPLAGWELLDPVKKQALEVIADKIARILSGDPNYDDNWIDIQGYAKLVQDRLPKETK